MSRPFGSVGTMVAEYSSNPVIFVLLFALAGICSTHLLKEMNEDEDKKEVKDNKSSYETDSSEKS